MPTQLLPLLPSDQRSPVAKTDGDKAGILFNLNLQNINGLVSFTQPTFSGSITPVIPDGGGFHVSNVAMITGALAVNAPTGNPVDGQQIEIRFQQDATGGRALTFNAIYTFPTTAPQASISTGANALGIARFVYIAAINKFRATHVS